MDRRVRLLLGLGLLVLVSCQATPQTLTTTQQSTAGQRVAALGRLEPKDRLVDISVAGDERLARLVVKQGQFVRTGEVLGYLESYDTHTASRDRAVAMVADAQAQLAANTERAQARIREADLHLSQLDQVSAHEIDAQEARIREIRADLDFAARDLERFRPLMKTEAISQQQWDRQSSEVNRYRAALESEEATLQKMRTSADTEREVARAQVTTQKAELESVRASSQLESLRQAVKVEEAELGRSIIRAPSNGQIIEIVANPGEAIQGRVILRMGDTSQMYVLAEVYEADVSRVGLNAPVAVSSKALSASLTGIVERIGTNVFRRQVRSLDPQADADARVVQVRVRLDNSEEAARFVGLQVDVLIGADK